MSGAIAYAYGGDKDPLRICIPFFQEPVVQFLANGFALVIQLIDVP